jgi:hypothetical protein
MLLIVIFYRGYAPGPPIVVPISATSRSCETHLGQFLKNNPGSVLGHILGLSFCFVFLS